MRVNDSGNQGVSAQTGGAQEGTMQMQSPCGCNSSSAYMSLIVCVLAYMYICMWVTVCAPHWHACLYVCIYGCGCMCVRLTGMRVKSVQRVHKQRDMPSTCMPPLRDSSICKAEATGKDTMAMAMSIRILDCRASAVKLCSSADGMGKATTHLEHVGRACMQTPQAESMPMQQPATSCQHDFVDK